MKKITYFLAPIVIFLALIGTSLIIYFSVVKPLEKKIDNTPPAVEVVKGINANELYSLQARL